MTVSEIDRLIHLLARLPGLGPRSARRAVLQMLKKRDTLMLPLATALQQTAQAVRACTLCGNLDTTEICAVCRDPKRDQSVLCVVEDVADLWAIERSGAFKGRYHVLGGTLSALDGRGPAQLNIAALLDRLRPGDDGTSAVHEVILALSATVDGQTTGHYIAERLADSGLAVTRLAHGVPVGGELDYLDDGTLTAALKARRPA
jgi:recombination protein RecR